MEYKYQDFPFVLSYSFRNTAGKEIQSFRSNLPVLPASNMKIVTGFAAYRLLGPEYKFITEVKRKGRELIFSGGPSPLLDFKALKAIAESLGLISGDLKDGKLSIKNINNTYYAEVNGNAVSQASIFKTECYLNGPRLKVASLGSVSTLEDYRHMGYSTAVIRRIIDDLTKESFPIMLISGEIDLYKKLDCVKTGQIFKARIKDDGEKTDLNIQVVNRRIRLQRSAHYWQLYSKEPFRYIRTKELMRVLLDSLWFKRERYVMQLLEARYHGNLQAYLVAYKKVDSKFCTVMEYAGSRNAVMLMAKKVNGIFCTDYAETCIHPFDSTIKSIMEMNDVRFKRENSQGTVRILNAAALVDQLQPWFIENFGSTAEIIANTDGSYTLKVKNKEFGAENLGDLTKIVFGGKKNSLNVPLMFTTISTISDSRLS